MPDDKPHLETGRRLQLIRENEGLGPKDFAEKYGFSRTQYTNWESGFRQIPIHQAGKLLSDGMTLDFIYLGRDGTLSQTRWRALLGSPPTKK